QRDLEHHRDRRAGADRAAARGRHGGDAPAERRDPGARGAEPRAGDHQHVRRLRGDAAHAAHVPEVAEAALFLTSSLATVAYIGATILFIMSLGGLSNPETSRRGNLYGILGMTIAVLATVFGPRVTPAGYGWIVGAMVVGASVGLYAARVVKMTQMPELVALMHSLVGIAAVFVGFANYIDPAATAMYVGAERPIHHIEIYLGIL